MLGYLEDGVPDAVMTTTFHAVIVPAMKRVVAESVLRDGAGDGTTVSGWHERNAEAVSHRRPKRPCVDVEVERRRGKCVEPIPSMRKCERVETCSVPAGGG